MRTDIKITEAVSECLKKKGLLGEFDTSGNIMSYFSYLVGE